MTTNHSVPALELRSVAKNFGSVRVLDDVTLRVEEGAALGVVGPNGAGKSTMLSIITGVDRATSGSVHYRGVDVTREPASRRSRGGIARSFQIPRPFVDLTAFENTLVGAQRGGGLTGAPAHVAAMDALRLAGMARFANTQAGKLSLLDRKRLELARALATGPRLLLLDEIAGGLTDAEAEELIETILQLKATGLTLVWIEHVVHALTQVVDRMVCLAFGRIYKEGTPSEVMSSREVQDVYLGSAL
jgi:branched-chain amino acid transport system ATP-binding protein